MTIKTYSRSSDAAKRAKNIVAKLAIEDFCASIASVDHTDLTHENPARFAPFVTLKSAAGKEIADALTAQGILVEVAPKEKTSSEAEMGGVQGHESEVQNIINQPLVSHQPTQDEKMSENTENTVDLNEALVTAEAAVEAAVEAEKANKESVKDAVKSHKAAVAYHKALADDSEDKPKAVELVEGWAAEVSRLQAEAPVLKEAVKAAKAVVTQAKKDVKAGAPKAEKAERIEQNGQVKPRDDSKSGKLWAIFDAATAERGSTCAVADVMDQCAALDMTEGSIRSAYSHWRKFNGVEKGRITSVTAPAMSEEKRAAEVEKLTAQLEKAQARVNALTEKLAAVQSAPTEADVAEEETLESVE